MVAQGEVYWADFGGTGDHEAALLHPAVIVQCNAANDSKLDTVLVCPCTTSHRRQKWPGNIELAAGEAQLPRRCLVEVTLLTALDRRYLRGYVGRLAPDRMRAIVRAINRLIELE